MGVGRQTSHFLAPQKHVLHSLPDVPGGTDPTAVTWTFSFLSCLAGPLPPSSLGSPPKEPVSVPDGSLHLHFAEAPKSAREHKNIFSPFTVYNSSRHCEEIERAAENF